MDVHTLSNLLATSYNPDPNVRKASELQIRKVAGEEGMLTALMHIIGNVGVEIATRQACAVYLKNRVEKCYILDESSQKRPDLKQIPDSDRQALKAGIVPLIVASPSKAVTVQLSSTLKTLISHDFPEKWPNLLEPVKQLLHANGVREVTAGTTALLEVVRAFRYRSQTEVLVEVINQTFSQLVVIGTQALSTPPSQSQDAPRILHLVLKIYMSSIAVHLSKHQQSPESLVPWGRLLFQVVGLRIPNDAVPADEEERERSEWWKAKKWAYKVLCRLFHRFGNPSQMPSPLKKDYLPFAEHFVVSFAPEIFKIYLQQVELLVSGQAWLSQKCQYNTFQFFTDCIKPKSTWELLKPHFSTLVSSFVAPQVYFTPAKQELWDADPVEYVRTHIDEYEDFAAPVSAATTFLFSLVNNRTKTTFLPILGFVNSILESNSAAPRKYGALNMTGALAKFIMRHPQVRNNMENFLVQHVFPEFNSSAGYMRSTACEVICSVEKVGMQWSNNENLAAAFHGIANALNDHDLPVRIQGALALNELITAHEYVQEAVRPQVEKVIQALLKMSDETGLDILNNCMETMVERYHNELLPVAAQLTARLCDTYLRLAREITANEVDSADDLDRSMELTTVDDDKTFAAMGVSKTISTIITSVDTSPELLARVEQAVVPAIAFTLENKLIDLFDNVFDLVDALTFNLRRITPEMWQVFELTYKLFKTDAINFLEEMLPSLDNFLSFGSDVMKTRSDYKGMILDIYTTSMSSNVLGDEDRVNANKLIESFLLNLRGHVDEALPTIISISLAHLTTASTKSLRLAVLDVLVNAVLYNPIAALHLMETTEPGSAARFFEKWFAVIRQERGLPRVHDKQLSIMAICALIELEPSAVPPSLQAGWAGLVAAALHVFKDLPRAVEARKALEDALREGDDEDEESETNELLDLEGGDDDADVWDEDSEYIEMLAKEGARLREKAANKDGEDDESDSSDDESIDEELGYISPLETVDPYVSFKTSLTNFQMKNAGGYQAATTSLNIEQQTLLMEIMAIAAKNSAGA